MAPDATRILVVDDHDVVHWGFRLLLERQSWVESCAAATNGKDALVEAARTKPHVALVDLFLAGESGAEIAEELRRVHPDLRVLLISGAGQDLARRRSRRRSVRLRLQGLGRRRRGSGSAHGRPRPGGLHPDR